MKLDELYRMAVSNWPNKITISDVCDVWDEIEKKVGIENPWDELGVWVIYQCLGQQKESNVTTDKESNVTTDKVIPCDIPIELFDYYMRENLGDISWTAERADYLTANGEI